MLADEPAVADATEVFVDGVAVPQVVDCDNEDGWVYADPIGPYDRIDLCGSACTQLKAAGTADIYYHCG